MFGWGWMHGGGLPFWWLGAGFRFLFLGAAAVGVVYLVRYFNRHGGGHRAETALEILQKRYARGEITREQFEEMKRNLS
jgi:putative membrane protein